VHILLVFSLTSLGKLSLAPNLGLTKGTRDSLFSLIKVLPVKTGLFDIILIQLMFYILKSIFEKYLNNVQFIKFIFS
jgi:hypothetical protein